MKSTDGIMFSCNVNAMTKYVCDNGEFRFITNLEIEADSTCTSYNINEYYVLPKAYDKKIIPITNVLKMVGCLLRKN